MSETAIGVDNVSKMYKLYEKPGDRLKEALGLTREKRYVEHYALNGVSFEVKKGETVGLIGTNGSGKSTMLKVITGILNPTGGSVEIEGRISALLELGAGFNMEYSGLENVYLNGTMIGFKREEIDARLEEILKFADIGDFVYQPVKTYSSGMFVRLAFAVAINIDPEILIVDEALSVGDVFFQAKCYKKFEEFKEQGKTILFVSHDLGSVSKYCDRVILLNKGEKVMEGEPKPVIDTYKRLLVHQFGGSSEAQEKQGTEKVKAGWKENLNNNPNCLEYGNGEAHIVDYAVLDSSGMVTNSISKGENFTVKFRVIFQNDIVNPIFAFTIKDLKGTEITGTNTMFEHVYVDHTAAGDSKIVSFTQEMNLQGGEYLLSLGCTGYSGDEFQVYHRLYDVCNITVISDKNSVGYYDMNSQIEISGS
ncbi:MAG: ABC transporter ATP-binding protein [Lachnospiraceae bacterium]|nr:ABC transporter ATP-binding protein [Lachnospiraceae bacterium]